MTLFQLLAVVGNVYHQAKWDDNSDCRIVYGLRKCGCDLLKLTVTAVAWRDGKKPRAED